MADQTTTLPSQVTYPPQVGPVKPGITQADEAPMASVTRRASAVYKPSSTRGFSQAEVAWLNQVQSRNANAPLSSATVGIRPADGTVFQYIGAAGGNGGQPFKDPNIFTTGNVVSVAVTWGDYVNSLTVYWQDTSTGYTYQNQTDGQGGSYYDNFVVENQPGEYLYMISGRFGDYVDSMVLTTNLGRQSNFYGGGGGSANYILFPPDGWDIVGFCGRAGDWINQIGIACRLRQQQYGL